MKFFVHNIKQNNSKNWKTSAEQEEALRGAFSGGPWCKENRCQHPLHLDTFISTMLKLINTEYIATFSGIVKKSLFFLVAALLACPWPCRSQEAIRVFTVKSSVEYALKHNAQMLASTEGVAAAEEHKKKQFAEFLPKVSANYTYMRMDEEKMIVPGIVTSPENLYTFTATIDQPVFSGFSRLTEYEVSALNLDVARHLEQQARHDIILKVKTAYFELLQKRNLETVAHQAVTQLIAHTEVARNFYQVGMIPKNDLLEAEVQLANARQDLVVASNNVQLAASRFNTVLRRPIDAPVALEDVMTHEPFTRTYAECVEIALRQRPEKLVADLEVETAEKEVSLTKKDYYPSIDLQANYYKKGDNPDLDGGQAIIDRDEWNLLATASWTFWEWGKTRYGVNEKLRRLAQTRLHRIDTEDSIRQQVKAAYLKLKEAEKNIPTVQKAVEQAGENFRMSEEQYKEQVGTSTEVLDAQTLLTKTQTNYYNALSAYNISKAALDRAMGVEVVE